MDKNLIEDGQELTGAKGRFGDAIPTYDDGFGPLWIARDSMGILGIIRAMTFDDAENIVEDEFYPEASETLDELIEEYGFERTDHRVILDYETGQLKYAVAEDFPLESWQFVRWETWNIPNPDAWTENILFCEAYGFRPNGPNAKDKLNHGIYAKDLNGDYLDKLTPRLLQELEITLDIATEDTK